MTVQVRDATPPEFAQAGRITAEAYREFVGPGHGEWEHYLAKIADIGGRAERTTVLVAVEGDEIVGTITLELHGRIDLEDDGPLGTEEAHIRMLGVAPAARGRGVAAALMRECEHRAREANRTLLTLNTTQRMTAAQRMYEALGYARGEDRTFPDGFVLLSFSKRL